MGNDPPGASVTNEVSGHGDVVIQAGVINGGVVMRQECASPLIAYLQAGEALASASPIRETSALASLALLLAVSDDMFDSVVDLVERWCTDVDPTEARIKAAQKVIWAGIRYCKDGDEDYNRLLLASSLTAVLARFLVRHYEVDVKVDVIVPDDRAEKKAVPPGKHAMYFNLTTMTVRADFMEPCRHRPTGRTGAVLTLCEGEPEQRQEVWWDDTNAIEGLTDDLREELEWEVSS